MNKLKVMIVDDTADNLQILYEILKDEFDVIIANSGEKALKLLKGNNNITVILLDVMMPGMDGYEVCTQIKSNTQYQDIPVIFASAKDDLKDKEKGLALGACDYLTKPFKAKEIIEKIRSLL